MKRVNNIEIENATLMFKNFSGIARSRYDREGDRNFCVVIDDPEQAQLMANDGWNVRILKPREDGEEPKHYLNVAINFNFWKKPEIYMICNGVKTLLDEMSVGTLDGAEIVNCDLVIRPRQWDDDGETKIKAYLQEMYVTIERSRFAAKYAGEEYPNE